MVLASFPLHRYMLIVLVAFAASVGALWPSQGQAARAENQCAAIFEPMGRSELAGRRWGEAVGKVLRGQTRYQQEFKEIGPARVLFRPVAEKPVADAFGFLTPTDVYYADNGVIVRSLKKAFQFVPRRVIGLIRGEAGRFNGALRGDPRYALTVMSGLQHLMDAPIYSFSQAAKLKRRYVSSAVLSLAALGGGTVALQMKYLDPYLEARAERIETEALAKATAANREVLLRSIRYDVRNRDLRNLWIRTVPDAKSAEEQKQFEETILEVAQMRKVSISTLFGTYAEKKFVATRESVEELVRYPEFEHLQSRVGAADSTPFDAAAWTTVFYLNWNFQVTVEAAADFVKNTDDFKKALNDPDKRDAYGSIFSNDFMLQVRKMYREKVLTEDEAVSLVGLDLYYRTRLAEARVLNHSDASVAEKDHALLLEKERSLLETAVSGRAARWDLP